MHATITWAARYTRIRELQEATGLSLIRSYIKDYTKKFYATNRNSEFVRRIREEKLDVVHHKRLLYN